MNLAKCILSKAVENPKKTAIYWGNDEWSYDKLAQQADWIAGKLRDEFGIKPGDRVGIWLKNCPEFVSCLLGIWSADAVVVPINNFLKADEAAYIIADAGINVLFTDENLAETASELQKKHAGLKVIRIEEIPASLSRGRGIEGEGETSVKIVPTRSGDDLAVVIYTSGTTGRPKGAMLSHANLLHNVESCRAVFDAREEDRSVLLLPMFHSFMLTVCVLLPLITGASILLIRQLNPAKSMFEEIIRWKGTFVAAVPAFFRTLIKANLPAELPLRLCNSGAAPLPVAILEEFKSKFSFPLIEGYGLSEASPVVCCNPLGGVNKPGSIGLPLPNVEVSIQDEEGKHLSANETGEVCVRGGNVMLGYWNKPEETAKAMGGDWLLTGDVGHQDDDGYVFITDRKKDMLLVNGINVYPREIEELIYQFPNIKEAAVVGKPDPRKGEMPIAFVALNEEEAFDEKALIQFLKSKLADYKIPRSVTVLSALPRTATGKILKTELRKLVT